MDAFFADLTALVHLSIVLFMVAGLVLTVVGWPLDWRWIRSPRFRLPHLAIMGYIVFNALRGELCFLTIWEHRLRIAAGQVRESQWKPGSPTVAAEPISFVGRLLRDLLYVDVPQATLDKAYLVFGLLVLLTWAFVPPRWRARKRAD